MRVYTRKVKEKWVDGEKFWRGKKSVTLFHVASGDAYGGLIELRMLPIQN